MKKCNNFIIYSWLCFFWFSLFPGMAGPLFAYTQDANEYPTIGTIPSAFDQTFEDWARKDSALKDQKGKPQPGVLEGGLGAASANLTHSIPQSKAWVNGVFVDTTTAKNHTYTASKTTYVFLNNVLSKTTEWNIPNCGTGGSVVRDGYYIFCEKTAGYAIPSTSYYTPDLIPLMQVNTSGTAITSVADLRAGGAINSDYYGNTPLDAANIGTTGKMPEGTMVISHQVFAPSGTTNSTDIDQDVRVERGGLISFYDVTRTLTFKGQFEAGNYPVFDFIYITTATTNATHQIAFKGGTVVNPVWFGLKANDTTAGDSNRRALQFAALSISDDGGVIEIPAGFYYININSADDYIPLKHDNTTIRGAEGGGTSLYITGGDFDFLVGNPDATPTGENLRNKIYATELSIKHDQALGADVTGLSPSNNYVGTCFRIKNARQGEASNLHIEHFKKGIVLQTRENFYIWRNWFYDCTEGIAVDPFGLNAGISTQTTTIENNQEASCYKGIAINTDWADFRLHKNSYALGNHNYIGVYMVTGDRDNGSNVTLLNESFENAGPTGVLLWVHNDTNLAGRNINIRGCNFGSGQGTAIKLEAAKNVNISENIFATSPSSGGTLYDVSRNCQNLTFTNNKQSDAEPNVWRPGKNYQDGKVVYPPNPSWLHSVYKISFKTGQAAPVTSSTNPFVGHTIEGMTITDDQLTWQAVRYTNGTIIANKWVADHLYAINDIVRPTGYYEGYGWKMTSCGTGDCTSNKSTEPHWPYIVGNKLSGDALDEAGSAITWVPVPYDPLKAPVVWSAGLAVSTDPVIPTYVYDPADASATQRYVMWKALIRPTLGSTEPAWPTHYNGGSTITDGTVLWSPADYNLSLRNGTTRPSLWQKGKTYATGDFVYPQTFNGFMYTAVQGGTSASIEPSWLSLAIPNMDDTATTPNVTWIPVVPSDGGYYKRWSPGMRIYIGDLIAPSYNQHSLVYKAFFREAAGSTSPFGTEWNLNNLMGKVYTDNGKLKWVAEPYDASVVGSNTWASGQYYESGHYVKAPGDTALKYMYKAIYPYATETSSVETAMPVFPLTVGSTVMDGNIQWTALNPYESDDTDQAIYSNVTHVFPFPLTANANYGACAKLNGAILAIGTSGSFDVDVRNYFGDTGSEIPIYPRPKAYKIALSAMDTLSGSGTADGIALSTQTAPYVRVKRHPRSSTQVAGTISLNGEANAKWKTLECTVPCDIRGGFALEYAALGDLRVDIKIIAAFY